MTVPPIAPEGFVIMQIGDPQLDRVYDEVFTPALVATGLTPRRVDRDNKGHLLKSEIVDFIKRAVIIIGDLTNARPNCYLEVGYTMGVGKNTHLILTVREDHHHRSPNHIPGGRRVHFDLEGYELLFWDPNDLPKFQTDLIASITRRLGIIRSSRLATPAVPFIPIAPRFDPKALGNYRTAALLGLTTAGFTGYFEATAAIEPKGNWSANTLRDAARAANIHASSWPIGFVSRSSDTKPHPIAEGIRAEMAGGKHQGYDYWVAQNTGDFYTLRYFLEDRSYPDQPTFFFHVRIAQVTELILFLSRLYTQLNVPETTLITISLTHSGLTHREISRGGFGPSLNGHTSTEYQQTTTLSTTVGELKPKIEDNVKQLITPVFSLFNFFEVHPSLFQEIIENVIAGKVI